MNNVLTNGIAVAEVGTDYLVRLSQVIHSFIHYE